MNLNSSTVEACRSRGGAAADDRPEEISEALEMEELGYGEGEPLVADTYADYPDREQLSNPSKGEFLRDLLSHPKVGGLDDVVSELTPVESRAILADWLATVESATEAHSLDTDTLTAEGGEQGGEDTLTSLLGYKPPADVVTANNPLLVADLYVKGLSIKEIADVLESKVEAQVREGQVRDSLKTVGLLGGKTRTEQREAFEKNDGKLGGTTVDFSDTEGESRGVTINVEDYA